MAGLESRYEKNALWKHSHVHHEGDLKGEEVKMEIIESHRSPLNWQIHEGVEIEVNGADLLLNSKAEFNRCYIHRLRLEE